MKPTKPTLNWELNVDCPFCGETFDLSDEDGDVHDYFFAHSIFRNEWAKIEGEDVDCPKCGASITLGEVEY